MTLFVQRNYLISYDKFCQKKINLITLSIFPILLKNTKDENIYLWFRFISSQLISKKLISFIIRKNRFNCLQVTVQENKLKLLFFTCTFLQCASVTRSMLWICDVISSGKFYFSANVELLLVFIKVRKEPERRRALVGLVVWIRNSIPMTSMFNLPPNGLCNRMLFRFFYEGWG